MIIRVAWWGALGDSGMQPRALAVGPLQLGGLWRPRARHTMINVATPFRTWLAGLPGKCMSKPLIDATGPAMCMTFIFASLWLTDVDERRLADPR